ncbi:Poxvirus D5 protein [Histomonas meleagridis]|uniref:Poxvirus D5 protein n=1 Tax=Histomonas meleagridis TaxID=135588 RepID=UPI00355A2FBA|nr:Poxvirus D5 protein [Histomonas meleagridis]
MDSEVIIEKLIENQKTLRERIGDNIIILTNYLKHDGGSGTKQTGIALLGNKISNLSVIDIDINKEIDEDERERIRKQILRNLSVNDVVVSTASGGLHIYCNTDEFYVNSNRMIKCYTSDRFDIDLMNCYDDNSRSLIVLPESKVRKNARSPIKTYSFIYGSLDLVVCRSLQEVLDDLDIQIKIKQIPEIERIMNEDVEPISEELADAIINGLENIEIHNDGGAMPLTREVTLFTLFQALNSLPDDKIDLAYEVVRECCDLTDNAMNDFDNARARYQKLRTSPYVLVKILKLYRKDYYEKEIVPLLTEREIVIKEIDLQDSFSMIDIRSKAEKKSYKNKKKVIEDLSRVIRFVESDQMMFIQKVYDIHSKKWKISFVNDSNMTKSLKLIKLWNNDGKILNAYNVFTENMSKLSVNGVKFKSNDKDIFFLFHGLKYKVLDNINESVIAEYLRLIHDVIADSNEEIYNYILNWISFIIQNPGIKTETALVLKGLQGVGKNTFTDVLAEMLAGYSENNVTEIGELTGNFNSVVEAKMLIVLNELKNVGDDRLANFNSLKSIITDKLIRINEKNQSRRTSENVANFVFVTNNSFPVKIEAGDRRYVVLMCNGKYKNDLEYFSNL